MNGGYVVRGPEPKDITMSKNNYLFPWDHHGADQRQDQDQHQKESQHQTEAQAHAQLEAQLQAQAQFQNSESYNDNGNGNANTNENTNSNYSDNTTSNTNSNTNTTHTGVKVDVGVNLSGIKPHDDDFADIDMKDPSIGKLLVNQDGSISYDPGNDISLQDVLNGALNGEGNDMSFIQNQNATINDKDTLSDAHVENNSSFEQNGNVHGGDAYADEGIKTDDGGNGGPATTGAGGAGGEGGMWGSQNGHDGYVTGISEAHADAAIDITAFNQSIVMGANLLHNQIDMTVVGGDVIENISGDHTT
jgi:hypothetical protein